MTDLIELDMSEARLPGELVVVVDLIELNSAACSSVVIIELFE